MTSLFKAPYDAYQLSRNPEEFFKKKKNKYGEVFPLFLPSSPRTLFSGSKEAAKEIFSASPKLFDPSPFNPIAPIVGEESLILLKGERHQKEKRFLMPTFSGQSLKENIPTIEEIVLEEVLSIKRLKTETHLLKFTKTITLQIITRIIFGIHNRTQRNAFNNYISEFINSYTPPLMFFPWLRRTYFNLGPWKKYINCRDAFELKLKELVEQSQGDNSIFSKLKILYGDNFQGLIDQLKTLLIAGHETTAITLFWAIYYLKQHPHTFEQLKDEIGNKPVNELIENKYLEAVILESMRMHPSVPIILRTLNEDFNFRNHDIKKGENIGLALTLLHHDPKIYDTPQEFNPLRFVDKSYDTNEFAPFGGGNRKCLGAAFAMLEMKIFLIVLIQNLDFELLLTDNIRPVINNLTMGPNTDIPFYAKK